MARTGPTTDLWYLSVHGGKAGGNNILSFDLSGTLVSTQVLDVTKVALRELRGFVVLPRGDLLIAHAHKGEGKVLHFGPATDATMARPYRGCFTTLDPVANPGLLHPFNLRIGPDGHLYVANQGSSEHKSKTNGVTRYHGPDTATPGEPIDTPHSWVKNASSKLFPGTVIPSRDKARDGVKRVRDLLFGPDGFFYVSDEKRNEVRRHNQETFEYIDSPIAGKHGLDVPVHLLVSADRRHLYIGSEKNNRVLRYHFSSGHVDTLVRSGSGGLDAPAGLACDDEWLYVCSRKGRQVLRYRLTDGSAASAPFIRRRELGKGSQNAPEFMIRVTVPGN